MNKRIVIIVSLALCLMIPIPTSPAGAQTLLPRHLPPANSPHHTLQTTPGSPVYYIICEALANGSIRPVLIDEVESAGLESLSDSQLVQRLHQPDRNTSSLTFALESATGTILYQSLVEIPTTLRGEFAAGDPQQTGTPIEGHFFPIETPVFVIKVPIIPNTWLVFRDNQSGVRARLSVNQLAASTPRIPRQQQPGVQAPTAGNPANRVDLLVMGDGYTAAEQTKFNSDANAILANFFNITPLTEYQDFFNIYTLFMASAQSGADHPPYQADCPSGSTTCCGDTAMLSDPLQGTFVNTAFDARYCANNIHRLLVVNSTKILAAAAAAPNIDKILVIVNDSTYGGSGGTFSVTSIHAAAYQIAQHEFGHSFAGLADEYETPYPGFPPCSDYGNSPCEVNVTDVAVRNSIKWNPWINPTTPIPTSETDPAYANVVGLFEGARYLTTGMYRSGQNCLMRSLGEPFCQVPSQAFVLKFYNGGWGVPGSGIELIEPDAIDPSSSNVTLIYPNSQTLQATLLQPTGAPPVHIEWTIQGVVTPSVHASTLTYVPSASDIGKTIQIRLLVSDTTTLVHPAMAGTSLQSSFVWNVHVNPFFYLPTIRKQ